MKKQNFLTMALIAAILGLASCGGNYKAKKANLSTQEDSLNYALGLAISEELRMNALQNDSSEKSIAALVEKIEKVYTDENTDQVYKTGNQIGNMMKEQRKSGLIGDSTMKFNEELFKKGLVKGIKGDTTGISGAEAMVYFQNTMQIKQNEKMMQAAPAPAPAPADSIKK